MSIATEERKWAMGILARAGDQALAELWSAWQPKPDFTWLRKPESGLVMVRGRMGGGGAAFNLGEMTVTRCALRIDEGIVGQACIEGRSKERAEISALVDALHQKPEERQAVRRDILQPLERVLEERRKARAAETADTRVEFFTRVRGDN